VASVITAQDEPTSTPTPQITLDPEVNPDVVEHGNMLLFGQEVNTMAVFVIGMMLIVAITVVFVRALVTAGRLPPPAALVTALAVLTMLSIAGGIFSDNDEAWTIAAAGIGALAGSVTAVFRDEASMVDRVTRRMEERREERQARKEEIDEELVAESGEDDERPPSG
jgi:hypothetical protein